jgi:hypothetical protein
MFAPGMVARHMNSLGAWLQLFYTANTLTICKGGERSECRASLPKSRSIEIASGKSGLASVADARVVTKPRFRHWHHGRLNWFAAAASFLKRIYSNRAIQPLPREYRGGPGSDDAQPQ